MRAALERRAAVGRVAFLLLSAAISPSLLYLSKVAATHLLNHIDNLLSNIIYHNYYVYVLFCIYIPQYRKKLLIEAES